MTVLGWPADLALPSDAYLRKEYGISQADYLALWKYQGGRCYVCHRRPLRVRLAVDHDHSKGRGRHSVRGLLCGRSGKDAAGRDYPACNRIIGMARDNPQMFRRAADYLESPPFQRMLQGIEDARLNAFTIIDCTDDGDPGWWGVK